MGNEVPIAMVAGYRGGRGKQWFFWTDRNLFLRNAVSKLLFILQQSYCLPARVQRGLSPDCPSQHVGRTPILEALTLGVFRQDPRQRRRLKKKLKPDMG